MLSLGTYLGLNKVKISPSFTSNNYSSTPQEASLEPLEQDTFVRSNSKQDSSIIKDKDGRFYKREVDASTGIEISTCFEKDGKTRSHISQYNPKNEKYKTIWFYEDGKTISSIDESLLNENRTNISYRKDGKTISRQEQYDYKTGQARTIFFHEDGKTISMTDNHNPKTGEYKSVSYQKDGKTLLSITEGNTEIGKFKDTTYYEDGKTISIISEQISKDAPRKITFYDRKGNVTSSD